MNGLNDLFAPVLAICLGAGLGADALRRMFAADGEPIIRRILLGGEFGFFAGQFAWGVSELLERFT